MDNPLDEQFRLVRAALMRAMDKQFKRMGRRVGQLRAIQIATVCLLDLAWAFHSAGQSMLEGDDDEKKEMFLKLASDISDQKPKEVTLH